MTPATTPTADGDRHELIDALRGFALAGVLLVNLGSFSQYQYLDDAARQALPTAGFDAVAGALIRLLVDNKAITLFSLLFGLGFSLQMERAANSRTWVGLYLRRVAILGLIGALHCYALWWGDILLVYALMALVLVLARGISDRALLVAGLVVALVLPPVLEPWIDAALSTQASEEAMASANLTAFGSPSYLAAMRQNAAFANWAWWSYWGVYFFVAGRFLLGQWAGRKRLLQDPGAHLGVLRRLCLGGLLVGVGISALEESGLYDEAVEAVDPAFRLVLRILRRADSIAMATGYAAGFALLYQRPAARRRLRWLAPVGRMALSNYLAQTIVCVGVFYGFGLGVGPRHGYVAWLLVWAMLFVAQVLASRWWLASFRFGPMEWLWRSLTHRRLQPMRRKALG